MPESSQSSPTPAPSSTPLGTTPTEPPKVEVWRGGPNLPEWARGKTAEEIVGITTNLMETVVRPGQPPAPPAPVSQPAFDPNAYTTGQEVENIVQRTAQSFQPTLQKLAENNAAATYRLVANDPKFSEVFQKYGPEVMGYLANVPKAQWTVDFVEGAAKLVKADHLDELVQQKAAHMFQNMEPTIRPTGGGPTPQSPPNDLSLKSDKLPLDWRDRAAKVGLDERTLDEFCFANGISREQFFKNFEQSLIVEVGKVKGV